MVPFALFAIGTLEPKYKGGRTCKSTATLHKWFIKVSFPLHNIARECEQPLKRDRPSVRSHLVQVGTNVTVLEKSPKQIALGQVEK